MAREIVVLCDPCLAEEVRTAAVESTVAVEIGAVKPNTKLKALALCDKHQTELLKPLADILEEFGVAVDANPKVLAALDGEPRSGRGGRIPTAEQTKSGVRKGRPPANGRPNQCLWCTLSYGATSTSGFGRHLRIEHGFASLAEAFGGPCPICNEGPFELMMSHMNRSHPEYGFIAVSQPFLWARDNGDVHGIYAETVAKKGSLDPEEEWKKTRAQESAEAARRVQKTAS